MGRSGKRVNATTQTRVLPIGGSYTHPGTPLFSWVTDRLNALQAMGVT